MAIAVFTLGGTISMAGTSNGGAVPRLSGAELVAAVPALAELDQPLRVHDVRAVPSASLTFAQVLDVVAAASEAVSAGATGVVVTQGTDTLEETAYLIDLVWHHPEPFVLTGAMRNPTLAGPDGPANLLAAARLAASPAARGLGALVAFNDEIHAARWVRKTHATSTAAFASPDTGPIGHVIEGRVRILTTPSRPAPLPVPDPERLAETRVGMAVVTLDDDGALWEGLERTHRGLVVAGFGVGHVPAGLAPGLGALAEAIPVALTSRTGGGSVLTHTYGAAGSEIDLADRGLLNAGMLGPYRARILLRVLLALDTPRADLPVVLARRR